MSENRESPSGTTTRIRRSRRELKCGFCSQSFYKTEHLARHERTHTKEKPFQCLICQKSYSRHDTLLRHAKSHADGQHSSRAASTALRSLTEGVEVQNSPDQVPYTASRTDSYLSPSDPQQMMSLSVADPLRQDVSIQSPLDMVPASGHPIGQVLSQMQSNPVLESHESDNANSVLPDDLWSTEYEMNWPTWSVGSEFDLQAINASIAATIFQQQEQPLQFEYDDYVGRGGMDNTASMQPRVRDRAVEAMNRSWISHADPTSKPYTAHGTITPLNEHEHSDRADVDEMYRSNLSHRLQPRPYDNSLPSVDFLNLSVQLYFAHFHPIFPIVHAATFRPSMANSLLLISICSVGSLFIGSTSATAQGIKIFETLNKSILNSWERFLSRSSTESLSTIQAAIIGQTFGMLSGIPSHLNLVDAFNGTVIAWARQAKMFHEKHPHPLEEMLYTNRENRDKSWKSWVQSEQIIRAVIALHLHDSELAAIFHHKPLLSHGPRNTPMACSERLFSALSAGQWAALVLQEAQSPIPPPAFSTPSLVAIEPPRVQSVHDLTGYVLLEGLGAIIGERREQGPFETTHQTEFVHELIAWKTKFSNTANDYNADPFCLMILWHSLFISLFADFDMLERAIGRDGLVVAEQAQDSLREWASSTSAKRCVAHALLLSNQLDTMHVGSEPAIHVPQCLFRAAVVWYLYACHTPNEISQPAEESADFPEIRYLGVTTPQHLFQTNKQQPGKPNVAQSRQLCSLRDMLQRLGHWGIARKFALLLGILLDGNAINHLGFE